METWADGSRGTIQCTCLDRRKSCSPEDCAMNEEPIPGSRLGGGRDRPAEHPGGMECQECGCIFIGDEWHDLCAVCCRKWAARDARGPYKPVEPDPDAPEFDDYGPF
jgi:hypothetical protein